MSLLPVLLCFDEPLRQKLPPVLEVTDEIRQLLADMAETMYNAPGIGLAANQVGAPYRAIVVDVGADEATGGARRLYKIVNPEIIRRDGKLEMEEGCLSVPDIREVVHRSARVTVTGLDENGQPQEIEAEGLLAVCLQHEIDHLDGILFIDHLSRLKRGLIKKKLRQIGEGRR